MQSVQPDAKQSVTQPEETEVKPHLTGPPVQPQEQRTQGRQEQAFDQAEIEPCPLGKPHRDPTMSEQSFVIVHQRAPHSAGHSRKRQRVGDDIEHGPSRHYAHPVSGAVADYPHQPAPERTY